MKLARHHSDRPLVSLVPLIDVMLILLVFFMVTSTYLNLDMIPFVQRAEENAAAAPAQDTPPSGTLLLRISADGTVHSGGRALSPEALHDAVTARLADNPLLSVVVLPSTQARTRHLVATLDTLTLAGATRVRLMQLAARP
ncbi:MAG: ExbD/TolR family protein [Pseudooceanicola sp.]